MSEVVLHSKLREYEEELKIEREVRFRHEKELNNLRLDINDLDVQLQEAKEAKDREVEATKKLRQDYSDLKQRYDNLSNESEESNQSYKRRHQDQISELSAHVEALTKSKLKYEKDNKQFLLEIDGLRIDNDSLARSKAQASALLKELENKEADHLKRVDDIIRQLTESNELKNKFANEKADLQRRNEFLEFEFQQINANLKRLNQDLDNARLQLENEILFRNTVENKLKNLQLDLNSANGQLEDANDEVDELKKQLNKAQDDVRLNREKTDKELLAKEEELEDVKRRLNSKYAEVQEQLTEALVKATNAEKNKQRLQSQVDSLSVDLDKTKRRAEDAVRHEKQLEKEIEEYRDKVSEINGELEASLQANRNYSNELSKAKHQNEQLGEQLESAQRDKRRLADELDASSNHLTDAQNRLLDSERRLKLADVERQQLQSDLDDTNDVLQSELNRNQLLSAQNDKQKADYEKRLVDKEKDLDAQRQSHRRQLESLQENFEAVEGRYKSEVNSLKKKYQIELEDLSSKYEAAKRARNDAENNSKRLQQVNKELNDKLIEEQNLHDVCIEQLSAAEKRASSARGELEELKTLYDRSEKARKSLELEQHEHEQKLSESQVALNRALAERKKYESDYLELYDSVHDLKIQTKNAEDRARNANAALIKKDEEIRHERELALEIDASRKSLDAQLKEAQLRVEEADEYARKESRRVAAKFEARLAHTEAELDLEKGKSQELLKEVKRLEKRAKDLVVQVEDEQAKVLSLTDSHEKLQEKMKKYRGQIEGAEGQVALNLSRCRRLQRELEDAEERAETMTRTFLRSGSVARTNDNYDDYTSDALEEYTNAVVSASSASAKNSTPSYLRSTYTLSKPTNLDDSTTSYSTSSRSAAYRGGSKYRTVDYDDDDDRATTPVRSTRYTSYYGAPSYTTTTSASRYYSATSGSNYPTDYMRARDHRSSRSRMSTNLKRALRGLSV